MSASAIGAGLMYLLDPGLGRRRRAVLRDKLRSATHKLARGADVTARDLRNRSWGQVARLGGHRDPDGVRGLQGVLRRPRRGGAWPFMQTQWSPTTRLLAGTAGLVLAAAGVRAAGMTGTLLGLGGLAFFLRGATNMELKRLTGLGAGRRAVTLQKTITVGAPPEVVFDAWRQYENFPRFMAHVREIRRTEGARSHWVVAGPAGLPIEWDTEETANVPNELLAWRTVPGSIVDHAGIIRFEPAPSGTRVHVRMSYNPPAGAIGHTLLTLFGEDPKSAMDEDLVRFKSLVEEGTTTVHGRTVDRREIAS